MRALVVALVLTFAASASWAQTVTCRDLTSDRAGAHACANHDGVARSISAPEGQADKPPAPPRALASTVGVLKKPLALPPAPLATPEADPAPDSR